jgi:SOS-response transcriptional repressor LexA
VHFDVSLEDLKSKDLSQGSGSLSTLRGTRIPMVSSKIAGKQTLRPDWPDRITVYCEVSPEAFDMDVSDDGMEPVLYRGDHVIVEPTMLPQPGDLVAVRVDGNEAAIVRKYKALEAATRRAKRPFELVPYNPDFASIASAKTRLEWLGVCIELRRSLKKP